MTTNNPDHDSNPHLATAYTQLCSSYQSIDTFRQTLLGMLPLASASRIFFPSATNPDKAVLISSGVFGFMVTLGLLIFEIRGIRHCTHLIVLGIFVGHRMGIQGQFRNCPQGIQPIAAAPGLARYTNEPLATAVIYLAVRGGWAFLTFASTAAWYLAASLAGTVFFIGFALLWKLDRWLVDTDSKAKMNELTAHQ
jgi:hypothetical protein